ncbi:tripartite tricarboxylate transporter substrate binding protein [Bacillus sp. Marseille-P3661]|uniref:tripartite tricarboxylate transporter substrate binding protein n=1 Tax=Bacillus sp. Marseille-P3661 TaxID=1936234 RepID=UPI000C845683|nr:tripartite tricarboxylate transporter substrate binding protein [Bacillus sp. Marseille-P3661]
MKKKLIVLLSIVLAVFSLLVGCSQNTANEETSTPAEKEGNQEEETKVSYPEKQIEIIVPFAAGGGTDAVGRVIAESLKEILGQDVVVVNREGGSGANGMQEGLSSKPDGYTLTVVTREVTSLPLLGTAPFETLDFKFVSNINIDPAVLVVSGKSEYKTVEDLVAAIKANPGKMKFAASAVPSYYGIGFSEAAGIDFTTVPYQGAAPAITEILGGGADFGIYNPGEIKSFVDSGDLVPLAVMAEERFAGFPDAPTFKDKGIDVVSGTYRGIAVPPETPQEIVDILEKAIADSTQTEKFQQFMNNSFLGIGYMNSEEFTQYVKNDIEALTPIIEIAKSQGKK